MLLITVTYLRLAYLAQRLGGRASCAHQKPLEVGGVFHCASRLCEEACFARGEVPGLGQPVDCVGEGLRQGAGPQLQLVAGPGVVAAASQLRIQMLSPLQGSRVRSRRCAMSAARPNAARNHAGKVRNRMRRPLTSPSVRMMPGIVT